MITIILFSSFLSNYFRSKQIELHTARKLEFQSMVAKEKLDEKDEQKKKLQKIQQDARIKKEKAVINWKKAVTKLEKEKHARRHLEDHAKNDYRDWGEKRRDLVRLLRKGEEIRNKCSALHEDRVERQKEIQTCENDLETKRKELAKKRPLVELESVRDELAAQRKELGVKLTKLRREENAMKADYRKNAEEIDDARGAIDRIEVDRVRIVAEYYREFQNAFEWVKTKSFKEKVVPVISAIFCAEPIGYKFLENVVQNNVFRAFLCTNSEDKNTIIRQARDKNWRILAVVVDVRDASKFIQGLRGRRSLPLSFSYLDQLVQSPPQVMQYLCDAARLHSVVCGVTATELECDELLKTHNSVLSREFSQRKIVSQYDRSVETIISRTLMEARVLKGGRGISLVDMEDRLRSVQNRQKKMSELLSHKSEEVRILEKEHEDIISQEREAARQIQRRRRLQTDITQIMKQLEKLRHASDSNNEAGLKEDAMTVNERIVRVVGKLADTAERYTSSSLELAHHVDDSSRFEEEVRYYKVEEKNADMMVRNVRVGLDKCVREREGLFASFEQKQAGFQGCIDKMNDSEREHYEAERGEMPDDLEQLARRIEEMLAEIRTIYDYTRSIRNQEEVEKELHVKEARLAEFQERWNDRERETEKKKKQWKELIKPVVTRIDESFQSLAKDIGLPSKVLLSSDTDDPEKWGIDIQIQFSDKDSLRTLSAAQHSGGERSVVTMLYLLSLQEICCFPFFLVDEINQGMDHQNEHRIFQLILKSCRSRQSFFVSPKLLNDMIDDSPEVKRNLTCIFVLTGAGNHLLDRKSD
jgi:structural maintenance of chromosomes protein 5